MADTSSALRATSDSLMRDLGSPPATGQSIADVPREIHVILAEWRDAERRATEARPESAGAAAAAAEVDRLRAEYRHAHEEAIRRRNT